MEEIHKVKNLKTKAHPKGWAFEHSGTISTESFKLEFSI
jgi:hypothetical protein